MQQLEGDVADEVFMYEITIEDDNVTFIIQTNSDGVKSYRLAPDGDEYILKESLDDASGIPDFLVDFINGCPTLGIDPETIKLE